MMDLSTGAEPPRSRGAHDAQRLYLMLKPHHALALEIDRQRRALGLDCSYALKGFHITLQPFGDIRAIAPGELKRIKEAAASLMAEPFTIQLDRVRGNALVGSNARALRDFRHRLVTRLAVSDVYLPDYDFDPHLSLCYGNWQQRNIPVSPIAWRVEQLLLINSVHGKGHEVVGSWQLTPRQGSLF